MELNRTIKDSSKSKFINWNELSPVKMGSSQTKEAEYRYINKLRNLSIIIGHLSRMIVNNNYSKLTPSLKEVQDAFQYSDQVKVESAYQFFQRKRNEVSRLEKIEKRKKKAKTSSVMSPMRMTGNRRPMYRNQHPALMFNLQLPPEIVNSHNTSIQNPINQSIISDPHALKHDLIDIGDQQRNNTAGDIEDSTHEQSVKRIYKQLPVVKYAGTNPRSKQANYTSSYSTMRSNMRSQFLNPEISPPHSNFKHYHMA